MDRNNFEASIGKAWSKAERLNLTETFSNGGSLVVDEEFRNLILRTDSKYEDVFLFGLTRSHYNFLLADHSFFQFTWNAINDVRYAFYPNPYVGAGTQKLVRYKKTSELLAAEFISYEDFLRLLDDERGQGRVPVLRYENAPGQYKALVHPCSHLHIGMHGEDRWAVRRLLSPLAFTMIVLRNYYGAEWGALGGQNPATGMNVLDEELIQERQRCALLDEEFFTPLEGSAFHIA